jgi:hypothetical protein
MQRIKQRKGAFTPNGKRLNASWKQHNLPNREDWQFIWNRYGLISHWVPFHHFYFYNWDYLNKQLDAGPTEKVS